MKYLWIICFFFIISCNKEKNNYKEDEVEVNLSFAMKYGNKELKINDFHVTETQDTFRTTMLKFYISNVVLIRKDGSEYKEPDSYHLFSLESPTKNSARIKGVPNGEYTQIRFALGIDSVRNHSGAQVGDLDPANGMFWTWSEGYLFLRFEGVIKKTPSKGLIVHIGEDRYYTPYEITLSQPLLVQSNPKNYNIPLKFDLYHLFNHPYKVDIDSLAHGYPGKVVDNLPFLINYNL